MKRIIITILFIVILSSCSMPAIEIALDLNTAWRMAASYEYQKDPESGDWKNADEFTADNGGDCEDFATYLLYLLGPDSGARMAVIQVEDSARLHAIVMLSDGSFIEPQIYGLYMGGGEPLWTLSYNTVMMLAGNGKRVLDNSEKGIDNEAIRQAIADCE